MTEILRSFQLGTDTFFHLKIDGKIMAISEVDLMNSFKDAVTPDYIKTLQMIKESDMIISVLDKLIQ